jgi:M6 family metalloprotease-like protein
MRIAFLTLSTIVAFLIPGPAHAQAAAAAPGVRGVLPRVQSVGPYQKSSIERLLRGTIAPVDSLDVIVFLVSFADREFNADHGMAYFENELRHLREYYAGASRNVFHPRTTIYPTIVELSGNEGYYGADGLWKERMAELLIEIVQQTDASVDFSRYDAFAVIHAGAGRETDFNNDSRYQIPSGFVNPVEMAEALKDTLGTPGVPTNDLVDGSAFQIDNLMVWPEEASQDGYVFGSLGIYAYQLGLRLGMLPLYDTTPDPYPDSQGVGNFDLMSYGIYNALGFVPAFPSAFNRYLMGWVEPVVVEGDLAVRLADVNSTGALDTALVKIPINASEYFLVENRVHDTNFNGRFDFIDADSNGVPDNADTLLGAEFDFFLTATTNLRPDPVGVPDSVITGSGLMIYHVDEAALRRALETGRYPNDDKTWKGVDLEEADHVQDLDSPVGAFAYGSFYDSFRRGNNDRFGPDTDPSSADNAGAPTGIEVDEISPAGHFMTFRTRFSPAMDFVRSELAGNASKLSPIPVDLDGDGAEDLVVASDTGLIYIADGAGAPAWSGSFTKIVDIPGAVWTGPPVFCDIDDDGTLEIFIASRDATLYAFEPSGAPFTIDDDGSPGSLKLRGDLASSPVALDVDSDALLEIAVFSSTSDSTFATVLNSSTATPANGWRQKGTIGAEKGIFDGRLASHPVIGALPATSGEIIGIGIARHRSVQTLDFVFLLPASGPSGAIVVLPSKEIGAYPGGLFAPAAGDIGGSGFDCFVSTVPGSDLCYWDLESPNRFVTVPLRGSNPSSPVLGDVDGDGTLETALRDDEYLYLFSGFGTPARGWPKKLDEASAARDRSAPHSPPVISDVNGDGKREIVFRVSGDLRAYDFSGREIEGWPLPGEGVAGGSIALLKGESGGLYAFDCASIVSYATGISGGTESGDAVVSLRRYDLGVAYQDNQAWPFYRHDAQGTGRQLPSGESSPRERVDPATFIVYPNPVTGGSFVARVLVSAPARVKVTVFNIEGEKVVDRTLDHTWFAGSAVPFETGFSTASFSGGVYICRIEVTGDGWSWTGAKKFAVIR